MSILKLLQGYRDDYNVSKDILKGFSNANERMPDWLISERIIRRTQNDTKIFHIAELLYTIELKINHHNITVSLFLIPFAILHNFQ